MLDVYFLFCIDFRRFLNSTTNVLNVISERNTLILKNKKKIKKKKRNCDVVYTFVINFIEIPHIKEY